MTLNIGKIHKYKGCPVRGWFSPAQKQWYQDTVRKIKNGVIVEIGVYGGASILSIADICVANKNIIFGVDPWEHPDNPAAWIMQGNKLTAEEQSEWCSVLRDCRKTLENTIKKLKYEGTIKLIQAFSSNVVDELGDADVVFIDGNHSYKSVTDDLTRWFPKTRRVIGGHDFQLPDIQKAVGDFCRENNVSYTTSSEIWEIRKK